jgi:response regulator RpfG family c-di-GMP phosphodiesterase
MRQHTILFVDDEENILSSFKRLLRNENYTILALDNPREVKSIMEHTVVSLIISDQRMPEINGLDLLKEAKELYPDTVRILLTGYADVQVAIKAINEGGVYRFISKPWSDEELRIAIRQSLAYYDLIMDNKVLLQMVQKQKDALNEVQNKYPDVADLPQMKDGAYVIENQQESLEDFMKRYFPKKE